MSSFTNYYNISLTYFYVIEIMSYIIVASKIIDDLYLNKRISITNLLFIILTIINLILYRHVNNRSKLLSLKMGNANYRNNNTTTMNINNNYVEKSILTKQFIFREHVMSEAGVQGFLKVKFLVDSFGLYTNNIYEVDNNLNIINELTDNDASKYGYNNSVIINEDKNNSKIIRNIFKL